mmetsp:Transcript_6605/g.11972  ORF Transcript_6605/g.11972 Transcript_6605/m.11972 type:complete len:199 (-) Transcript_6605:295-891(-)
MTAPNQGSNKPSGSVVEDDESAVSAAGALLKLGGSNIDDGDSRKSRKNRQARKGKKTDVGLRNSARRYRSANFRPLRLPRPGPLLLGVGIARHPTEISDEEDENFSRPSSSRTTNNNIMFQSHNYYQDSRRIPGEIGNINDSFTSKSWIGKPLGPPPRLPFAGRQNLASASNAGTSHNKNGSALTKVPQMIHFMPCKD